MEIEQSKAQLTASSWNATTRNPQIQEPNKQKQVDEDEKVLIVKPNSNDSLSYETKLKLNAKAHIRKDYADDSFMFPPGYRFCPYDEELIMHYLRKKVMNQPLPHDKIIEVNLYQHSPQELSEKYPVLGEKEWYFFTPRDRKYPNGNRPNRAAGTGYWKATGADKPIKYKDVKVGFRKALVFYEGKPPKGDKTNWIMHEFRVNESRRVKQNAKDMRLDDWVLCRIYKKVDKSFKSTRKDHEQQYASRSCSSVGKMDNCDYEGTVDSSIVASQNFEPPYQYDITFDDHIMDYTKYNPDYFSHSLGYGARSNYGMVQPSFSPGSVFWDQKVYQESINFPMHFEFPNYYQDPYETMDELQSQNVLGSVFDNSSMDKL